MSKKRKVTVRFPKSLRQEMLRAVIDDKCGMRGKSGWVSEAVISFLSYESFVEMVDIGLEMIETELSAQESFYFNQELIAQLEDAVVKVRHVHPKSEGVRSVIIRSAVLQRLFRPGS